MISHLLGTGLGGGQRGACNVPPSRGQRAGTGQNVRHHSLLRVVIEDSGDPNPYGFYKRVVSVVSFFYQSWLGG